MEEDPLKKRKMEDDLNFFESRMTTSKKMKDDLKQNGRRPKTKWKTT